MHISFMSRARRALLIAFALVVVAVGLFAHTAENASAQVFPTTQPLPTATATACGAPAAVTNGNQINVPICPSPYPTPTVNATATACGAAAAGSGQTVSVPVCPSPYPTPTVSATATACGAAVSASGRTVSVPVCPTTAPGSQVYAEYDPVPISTATTWPASTPSALATPSVSLGTSSGPVGAWRVTVTMVVGSSTFASAFSYCIAGASAGTSAVATYYAGSSTCNTTDAPANPLAGIGAGANAVSQGMQAVYSAQYANGSSPSFTCYLINSSTAEASTLNGFCSIEATPI